MLSLRRCWKVELWRALADPSAHLKTGTPMKNAFLQRSP
jgi:hypothetical protein